MSRLAPIALLLVASCAALLRPVGAPPCGPTDWHMCTAHTCCRMEEACTANGGCEFDGVDRSLGPLPLEKWAR